MDTWGLRGTLAAAAVAVAIAGLGGAAIHAATGSYGHVMGARGPAPMHHDGSPAHDGSGGSAPVEPTLHDESVAPDGSGGFTTTMSQTGTVTAISATSVTARSADGYVQTYLIPGPISGAATTPPLPPFAVGDQVTVRATRNGADAIVTTIRRR